MTEFAGYVPGSECPRCGAVIERWPHLDGSGYVLSCSVCHFLITEAGVETEEDRRSYPELTEVVIAQGRPRKSGPAAQAAQPSPSKAKTLISGIRPAESEPEPPPGPEKTRSSGTAPFRELVESEKVPTGPLDPDAFEGLPDDVQNLLRDFRTSEPEQAPPELEGEEGPARTETEDRKPGDDVTHVRPFYPPVDQKTGELSPNQIVRLAAEEGIETEVCPHCRATIATGQERCPWCDNLLA